ncbi:hypothetical protein F5X99DRAFT_387600 [Biscogniauxia marginata]|nr:hypothetical protein F5X99DRAFT_387600 [Biscogniauxia marginata]
MTRVPRELLLLVFPSRQFACGREPDKLHVCPAGPGVVQSTLSSWLNPLGEMIVSGLARDTIASMEPGSIPTADSLL